MSRRKGQIGAVPYKNRMRLLQHSDFREYDELRERLHREKYNSIPLMKMDLGTYRNWLRDISEIIFIPNGPLQRFFWDTMSEQDKLEQERKAFGRRPHNSVWSDEVGDWVSDDMY